MDTLSKEKRHATMAAIHSKDTKPELIVRRYLWQKGFRYRKNVRRLPGTPDIVLRRYSVVIFVHGCFWHGHDCGAFRMPKTNTDFWRAKIERNRNRDVANKDRLLDMGWNVITVWECQLQPRQRERTLREIEFWINHSMLLKVKRKYNVSSGYEPVEDDMQVAAEPDGV